MTKEILSYCGNTVKESDYDRYICTLFAPEKHRERLFTIYAFNSEIAKIKDIVSQPISGYVRLQWWKEAIDKIYAGTKPNHPIAKELFGLIHEIKIPSEYFQELIDARIDELELEQPATMDELINLAFNTSAKLSKLATHVINANSTYPTNAIENIGIAWALTGIMRSMRYNCSKGRVLIPKAFLDKHNVSREDIMEGKKTRFSLDAIEKIVKEAENRIISANDNFLADNHKDLLPVLLPATIAKVYLNRIRKNGFNLFTKELETGYSKIHFQLAANSLMGKF